MGADIFFIFDVPFRLATICLSRLNQITVPGNLIMLRLLNQQRAAFAEYLQSNLKRRSFGPIWPSSIVETTFSTTRAHVRSDMMRIPTRRCTIFVICQSQLTLIKKNYLRQTMPMVFLFLPLRHQLLDVRQRNCCHRLRLL